MHDFRRPPQGFAVPLRTPQLVQEIRKAYDRREWALELSTVLDEAIPPFSAVATLGDSVEETAVRLRESVGITLDEQAKWRQAYEAFRGWRNKIESAGILTLQATTIQVDEARGFSISMTPLPVVVVNIKDAPRGRIFTLLHELTHVMLKEGGVAEYIDPSYFGSPIVAEICSVVSAVYKKHPKTRFEYESLKEVVKAKLGRKRRDDIWPEYKRIIRQLFDGSHKDDAILVDKAAAFAKERRSRKALVDAEKDINAQNYERAIRRFERLGSVVSNNGRAKVWDSAKFKKADFPPREPLAVIRGFDTPVLTARSLNEIFAWRGTGKSMLAMGLASALSAKREFLNWKITRKCRVLYVDGELPNTQIQERMKQLLSSKASFRLITQDDQEIPNLATVEGQVWLERELGDTEVLILDSVTSLAPFSTNDEDRWLPFSSWLQRLRLTRGLCIIRLMQAGRQGGQRGHSRSEDLLDMQIKLTAKAEDSDHLKAELTYEKFRGPKTGVQPSFWRRQVPE